MILQCKKEHLCNPFSTSPLNSWARASHFSIINYPKFSVPFKQFLKQILQIEWMVEKKMQDSLSINYQKLDTSSVFRMMKKPYYCLSVFFKKKLLFYIMMNMSFLFHSCHHHSSCVFWKSTSHETLYVLQIFVQKYHNKVNCCLCSFDHFQLKCLSSILFFNNRNVSVFKNCTPTVTSNLAI